ncbi:flavin reductase family protein [Burkholderia sp. PAMC 26561]|uniref:flavin reductase family protein n=1 Tax=Burkholderia sp. PAMC 26561 TaxID=1795043 RepID=UPI00076B4C78|nr:flavin reductase family protein [Burkholderia sp. PAMC 26561]AME27139.1 flavin oxidoreductase [Burkholderia sp. PAMC 26561]AME27712.1 flavin oxidoreductase [Burkholderia sp. PAMC 26561]
MELDNRLFRSVMGLFATGVTVITYVAEGKPAGMTANAFMSVSMEPPLVLVSVRKQSRFNDIVHLGVRYGVNFLAEHQQAVSAHFGGKRDETLNVPYTFSEETPLIVGSLAHIVARTTAIHEAGDHLLYVAQIEGLQLGEQRKPLVFFSGKYKQVEAHAPAAGWTVNNDCW